MWSRFVMSQVKHNSYFLCGVALGLWVSLAVIPLDDEAGCAGLEAGALPAAGGAPDEFEPAREERPLGAAGAPAGRSVQRPRYYTTELGMRGSLLSGVLSSEDALKNQVAALNQTMARLQPALKFFITASAMSAVPGLANVVGFTDTREMLKPFHALKYLADNYLEEYEFFFLVSDGAFVNARRLAALVSKLSVSQDLYMGTVAEDDSQYCSLESGFLISNGVLRAVHAELDWCVRNSYSAHHHENIGRCILHAAHRPCTQLHQGESYQSIRLPRDEAALVLAPALADAVTAHPASPVAIHTLHAYVARVQLERLRGAVLALRAALWSVSAKHPPGYRNATWPGGLRAQPARPDTRFDHLRWTLFNGSHAFMPDEHRALAPLPHATHQAVQLVLDSVRAWSLRRWAWARAVTLEEGAWQWDPPAALRYRLLVRLRGEGEGAGQGEVLRLVSAVRPLGAGRLVPVRYVTESARVWLVAPLPCRAASAGAGVALLQRYQQLHAPRDANTNLHIVSFREAACNMSSSLAPLRAALAALPAPLRATAHLHDAGEGVEEGVQEEGQGEGGEARQYEALGRRAVRAAGAALPKDALVLLIVPDLEFNQDFLNRVRMNTIVGVSWFLPLPFRRHALLALPRAPRSRSHTGRFNAHAADVLAFYRSDLDTAEAEWRGESSAGAARVLCAGGAGAGGLRVVRAPEPGAVLPPRPRPRPRPHPALDTLDLGSRAALAQLLLETEHEQQLRDNTS